MNWDISHHALKGNVIAKTYKLEIVMESGEDGWQAEWCKEWDEARLKLLKIGGKCLKV